MPEIEQARDILSPVVSSKSTKNALFGKYELGKLLGCGAFAKVFHARDLRNGESVAIKIINKNKITNNTKMISSIKREISIMRRMHHPHIVKLFEVLASKSKIYFVMEFVKGGELFKKISSKGKLNESQCRKYFQQLISALHYCHSHGVYHRDLKPENLLLDGNGDLKVSDFGLSAVTDQVRQDGLLHTLCGTPAYVAPEILSRKGYDGAKIDLWSCGVILYVLSAGYLPFSDPNLMVMYKKIYKGDFRCPKWISPELKRLLSRLLHTNPMKRITLDEIKHDSWFKKGYKETKLRDEDFGVDKIAKPDENGAFLFNAFDLISFSSGLDLSGLFDDNLIPVDEAERLVVEKSPELIIEKVDEMAKEEGNIRLKKRKEWGVELKGQNDKFCINLEIHQLTEKLAVVEVKRLAGEALHFNEFWEKKIKPEILCR